VIIASAAAKRSTVDRTRAGPFEAFIGSFWFSMLRQSSASIDALLTLEKK
jgi:hypothetical protein